MKKIFWSLMILGVLVSSCRKNSSEKDGDGEEKISRNLTDDEQSFKGSFDGFKDAFSGKDMSKLNEFVTEDGVYAIFTPAYGGAYSDFIEFKNMDDLMNSEELKEALIFVEQALASGQIAEGEIIYEELDDVDPCDYNEMKISADYGSTDVLSKTYQGQTDQTGENIDEKILADIKAVEKNIQLKVYIGVGEEAEVLYFSKTGEKWNLSIIDVSECAG
jgi:hypothetical protein